MPRALDAARIEHDVPAFAVFRYEQLFLVESLRVVNHSLAGGLAGD
jgi:hypothetical protein